MGKHGKNLGKTQAKTAQKAKLLKKAKKAAAPPKQAPKPKAAAPPAKKASKKKAVQDMDVDEFLAGDHLDDAAPAPSDDESAADGSSDDDDDDESLGGHQAELDALATRDPEFYKYLQENDSGLLAFQGDGDEAMDDVSDADSDDAKALDGEQDEEEDEEEEEEEEEDDDDDDDDDEGAGGLISKGVLLTAAKFEELKASLAGGSFRSTKRLVALARAACGGDDDEAAGSRKQRRRGKARAAKDDDSADSASDAGGDSDDDSDEEDAKAASSQFEIVDPAVREAAVALAFDELAGRFRALVGAKPFAAGGDALAALAADARALREACDADDDAFEKCLPLVRSTLRAFLSALKSGRGGERSTTLAVLACGKLGAYAPWLAVSPLDGSLAPRFARALVGHLCRVVEAPPEGSEDLEREALNARERQLQVDAYVRLREVVACGASSTADASRGRKGDSVEEYVLKRAYNGLARDVCGFDGGSANPARAAKAAPSLAFATSCVAELYADASPDAAYRTAFVYVRQLALKVRQALATKAPKDVGDVLCWRFLNAARAWAAALSRRGNAADDRLGELVFPLCQVLFGAIELAQAPRYAPFRMHCAKALHGLAATAEVYVPTTKCLLATLRESLAASKGLPPPEKGAAKKKQLVDYDGFAHYVDLGDGRDGHCRVELAREVVDALLDYLEVVKYSAAAPELAIVPSVALKALAKEKKCHPKLRAAATAAAATFEAAADDAAKKRATIGAAPKDVVAFEPLLPKGAKPARDRLATRVHVREARRKRLRGLVPAAGDATAAAAPAAKAKKAKKAKKAAPAPAAAEDDFVGTEDKVGELDPDDF